MKDTNPGGVGAPRQLAVLKRPEGEWKATEFSADQLQETLQDIEVKRERLKGALHEELDEAAAPDPPLPDNNT